MTSTAPTYGIILFAHGARDPRWSEPLERLRRRLSEIQPDYSVSIAYLELMTPPLDQCVADMAQQGVIDITIVPAFMARGAHVRRDLPVLVDAIRARYPQLSIHVTEALGETDEVIGAMAAWIGRMANAATRETSGNFEQTSEDKVL